MQPGRLLSAAPSEHVECMDGCHFYGLFVCMVAFLMRLMPGMTQLGRTHFVVHKFHLHAMVKALECFVDLRRCVDQDDNTGSG
jgi:hypothetical protein